MAVTAFIPQIWSAFLQTAFQEREVIASTLTREFEGEAVRGNVVRVPFAATPSVVDYAAAGRTINAEEATVTTVDVPVDHEDAFAVKIDDVDRAQAAGSFEPVMRAASGALVEKYETRLAEMLLTGGTALDGSGTDAADGDAAFDVVMDLRQALSQAKAPLGERFLIVNPEFSRMLLGADSKLTSVDAAGDAAGLRQATIGQLAGFTVVETAILSPVARPRSACTPRPPRSSARSTRRRPCGRTTPSPTSSAACTSPGTPCSGRRPWSCSRVPPRRPADPPRARPRLAGQGGPRFVSARP
ncbi:P22 phage major capsid protein family protein [Prauserella oleivorans]